MQIKSQKDFWAGVMFVVVGAGFAIGALNYSFGESARPGPGYFPFGLGMLLAVLGGFTIFEALTVETSDGEPIGHWPLKQAAWILGAVVLFGLLLPRLGMFIALPLLVLVSAKAGSEFKFLSTLILAIILTVGSYLVFILGLNLTIPLWPQFGAAAG